MELLKDELYYLVLWPESQDFIGKENCHLVNDDEGTERYGSSAYFVRLDVYEKEMKDKSL